MHVSVFVWVYLCVCIAAARVLLFEAGQLLFYDITHNSSHPEFAYVRNTSVCVCQDKQKQHEMTVEKEPVSETATADVE